MMPDKIYVPQNISRSDVTSLSFPDDKGRGIEYIRKDALLKWAEKELERLWELVPDSDKVENETATPMEMRYLGQYMQMESVIDKLNEM